MCRSQTEAACARLAVFWGARACPDRMFPGKRDAMYQDRLSLTKQLPVKCIDIRIHDPAPQPIRRSRNSVGANPRPTPYSCKLRLQGHGTRTCIGFCCTMKLQRLNVSYLWCILAGVACGTAVLVCISVAQWPLHRTRSTRTCVLFATSRSVYEPAPPKTAQGGPCDPTKLYVDTVGQDGKNRSTWSLTKTPSCPRSYAIPRDLISQDTAARIRCTSSFANAALKQTSRDATRRVNASDTSGKIDVVHAPASICVFYLNYRNHDNLVTSVKTHVMRTANPTVVSHTVLTMDEDQGEADTTRRALENLADVSRMVFPPGTRGGDPLPTALRVISLLSACALTVVSDSDAFMLRDGWDQRILSAFLDPRLSLFASNARHRSHGTTFLDVAEWNWMAYRTEVFRGLAVGAGPVQHIDVGHYYSHCANETGGRASRVHMEGTVWPYHGKAATVVTDQDGSPWIMHLFYASRHNNEDESIKKEARRYSLTASQLAELRVNLTRSRVLDPRLAFGLAR